MSRIGAEPTAISAGRCHTFLEKNSPGVNGLYCVQHSMPHGAMNGPPSQSNLFENLRLELRRGCLVVAVLAQLRKERYGYNLRIALAGAGLEVEEGTLYPLLRRLESQGLLVSEWRTADKRKKRFYRISSHGEAVLKQLLDEWRRMSGSLNQILPQA